MYHVRHSHRILHHNEIASSIKICEVASEFKLRKLARGFEAWHDIFYVVGAIDGPHIPILAPIIRRED